MNAAITKISQLVPKPHINADELNGDTEVTIVKWIQGEVGQEKKIKGKLIFEEFDRPLILNAGKRDALIAAFGDDLTKLPGKKVTLFPTTARNPSGQTVPAVGLKVKKQDTEGAA